jgi:hypothetical protein
MNTRLHRSQAPGDEPFMGTIRANRYMNGCAQAYDDLVTALDHLKGDWWFDFGPDPCMQAGASRILK